MKTLEADVTIIGAGTAGLTALRQARSHGAKRVILVEGGPHGTTCARVGCMPSKLLLAAAHAAHAARHAGVFGVHGASVEIDGPAVLKRVRSERDRFVASVVRSIEKLGKDERIDGWARFVGPTTLEVDDHTRIETRTSIIAAGTSPFIPPPYRGLGDRLLTSDDVFELRDLPKSIAVLGTGAIGLELGQAFRRLGVKTAFFNPIEEVTAVQDPVIAQEIRRVMGSELDLRLGVDVSEARRVDDGVRLAWTDGHGGRHEDTFERVLCAAGRKPNLKRLELHNTGIELDERGVPRFDHRTMQCGEAPIFIAGDIDGERQLLHEAADEGRYAGTNAARWPDVRAHTRRVPLAIVFTEPQVAIVGVPGDQVGCEVEFGEIDYRDQGRARVMNQNVGKVRIWAKRDCGHLTGAEMFGPSVEHTAHLLCWAMQSDMTVTQALGMPVYHPTVEEGIRSALRQLASKLKMAEKPRPLDCGPGV